MVLAGQTSSTNFLLLSKPFVVAIHLNLFTIFDELAHHSFCYRLGEAATLAGNIPSTNLLLLSEPFVVTIDLNFCVTQFNELTHHSFGKDCDKQLIKSASLWAFGTFSGLFYLKQRDNKSRFFPYYRGMKCENRVCKPRW